MSEWLKEAISKIAEPATLQGNPVSGVRLVPANEVLHCEEPSCDDSWRTCDFVEKPVIQSAAS